MGRVCRRRARSGRPLVPRDKDRTQCCRAVGHEAVDPEVQEPVHLVGFVDGPHVDLQSALVGVVHETPIDNRDTRVALRYLEAVDTGRRRSQPEAGQAEPGGVQWSRRGAELWPKKATAPCQASAGKRSDADPVQSLMALDGLSKGAYDPIVFGVDVDTGSGEGLKEFVQSGDVLHTADPCFGYLGGRGFRDETGSIGHSIQRVIVEGQYDAVSSEVDVGLQIAVAKL